MSLLKGLLKKKQDLTGSPFDSSRSSKKNVASSSASFISRATTIQSVASFYTNIFGGSSKQAKRRRPDTLTFGAPTFYHDTPPPVTPAPGVERLPRQVIDDVSYTAAFAVSDRSKNSDDLPRAGVFIFSKGPLSAKKAVIYDQEAVVGELRLLVSEPRIIESIKVSFVIQMQSDVGADEPPLFSHEITVWSKTIGSSTARAGQELAEVEVNSGNNQWPIGIHVFPFTFPSLPQDVTVFQREEAEKKNKGHTRVDLPPDYYKNNLGIFKGQITYVIRFNVEYAALSLLTLAPIPDVGRMELTYLPRTRPLPKELPPFPLLPTRDDWPLNREEVGGWNLTPFGGRGRFDGRIVEFEGVLGVPHPPVFSPHERIQYKLILWSTDSSALTALARPSSIAAAFCSNEVYGRGALAPRTDARKARRVEKLGDATVVWVSGGTDPTLTEDLRDTPQTSSSSESTIHKHSGLGQSVVSADSSEIKARPLSPIREGSRDDSDEEVEVEEDPESLNYYPGSEGNNNVFTFEGVVPAEAAQDRPSFNYKYMNRNYMLKVVITHPRYSHISPSAQGIYAEAPLWITSDPPSSSASSKPPNSAKPRTATEPNFDDLRKLPVIGWRAIRLPSTSENAESSSSTANDGTAHLPTTKVYFYPSQRGVSAK